jgi:hypothetical protein
MRQMDLAIYVDATSNQLMVSTGPAQTLGYTTCLQAASHTITEASRPSREPHTRRRHAASAGQAPHQRVVSIVHGAGWVFRPDRSCLCDHVQNGCEPATGYGDENHGLPGGSSC